MEDKITIANKVKQEDSNSSNKSEIAEEGTSLLIKNYEADHKNYEADQIKKIDEKPVAIEDKKNEGEI